MKVFVKARNHFGTPVSNLPNQAQNNWDVSGFFFFIIILILFLEQLDLTY